MSDVFLSVGKAKAQVPRVEGEDGGSAGIGGTGERGGSPFAPASSCRRKDHGPLPLMSPTLKPAGLNWRANLPEPGSGQ
jgi:hypothetical protein